MQTQGHIQFSPKALEMEKAGSFSSQDLKKYKLLMKYMMLPSYGRIVRKYLANTISLSKIFDN